MGRRARRRSGNDQVQPVAGSDHQARVRVSDEVWRDFKASTAGKPISRALGTLVEQEVDRYCARRVAGGQVSDRDLVDALERAEELEQRIGVLVRRLEAAQRPKSGGERS